MDHMGKFACSPSHAHSLLWTTSSVLKQAFNPAVLAIVRAAPHAHTHNGYSVQHTTICLLLCFTWWRALGLADCWVVLTQPRNDEISKARRIHFDIFRSASNYVPPFSLFLIPTRPGKAELGQERNYIIQTIFLLIPRLP